MKGSSRDTVLYICAGLLFVSSLRLFSLLDYFHLCLALLCLIINYRVYPLLSPVSISLCVLACHVTLLM